MKQSKKDRLYPIYEDVLDRLCFEICSAQNYVIDEAMKHKPTNKAIVQGICDTIVENIRNETTYTVTYDRCDACGARFHIPKELLIHDPNEYPQSEYVYFCIGEWCTEDRMYGNYGG